MLVGTNFGCGTGFQSDEQKFPQDFRHCVEQKDRLTGLDKSLVGFGMVMTVACFQGKGK